MALTTINYGHYRTDIPTDTYINAQRLKPAHLPWESRIRREDPARQGLINNPQRPDHNTDGQGQRGQIPDQQQGQEASHNTDSETNTSDKATNKVIHNQPRKVEKMVNLKKYTRGKWYQVKFKDYPKIQWYREGSLNIPQTLIDECLKRRTWAGTPRKRRKKTRQ